MADLAPSSTAHRIQALEHDTAGVTLHWDDGLARRLPALWLRDNCPCPQCRHPEALERTFTFIDHEPPWISSATLRAGGILEVTFGTGSAAHVACFTAGWLRAHDVLEDRSRERGRMPRLWDSDMAQRLPALSYARYMQTPEGLRAWIEALAIDGIVLVRGVPQEPGRVLEVARRVGPVRSSNFGESYDVVSMPRPNASAYTQMGLELHTDLANWRLPPDVQLLMCLKSSTTGGDSVFADGFRIAEALRAVNPPAFELLSTHEIRYRFHDESCDIRASAPVIGLDRLGRVGRIRFNNWLREPMVMPEELLEPMYAALAAFWTLLRDAQYRLRLRLAPGDLIAYNNHRILHGRTAFEGGAGERHLQGCYLNQEDIDSRLRLLERRT